MFELKNFYDFCSEHDVDVIPMRAPAPGVTMKDHDCFAVFLDFSQIRSSRLLKGVCCHELGHLATGALHKVDSPYELAARSEYRANRWEAEHYITADDFRDAFAAGYTEPWELAEYMDLPEEDIRKALAYWSERKEVNFNR